MKLKKAFSFILALLIFATVFVSPSCAGLKGGETATENYIPKTLKLLAVGNSFSDDAVQYIYTLAKKAGVTDVVVASLDIPGCELKIHRKNAQSDAPAYKYSKCSKSTGGKMKIYKNISMLTALKDENWNYISLQQASALSGIEKSYNGDLEYLVKYIMKNRPLKTTKLCWHMTWAYAKNFREDKFEAYHNNQKEMYEAICNAVTKKIETNKNFSFMIPVGTAIQNLRTSYIGDRLNRDGRHLNEIGRYTAALMFVKSLGISIDNIFWTPKSRFCDEFSQSYLPAIKSAVNAAFENPLEVTSQKKVCNHNKNATYKTVTVKKGYPATCLKNGLSNGLYCKTCKQWIKKQVVIPKNENHSFKYTVDRPATMRFEGEKTGVCSVCKVQKTVKIAKIQAVSLSKTAFQYTGKAVAPIPVVTDENGKTLKEGTDYTVSYTGKRIEIGRYTVKVTFKNKFSGSTSVEFNVVPRKTEIKKLKAESGGFFAEWKAQKNINGYVLEYTTSSVFDQGNVKSIKIKNPEAIKKFLKAFDGGTYYVRIKTFFNCKNGALYSAWSKTAKIKLK